MGCASAECERVVIEGPKRVYAYLRVGDRSVSWASLRVKNWVSVPAWVVPSDEVVERILSGWYLAARRRK